MCTAAHRKWRNRPSLQANCPISPKSKTDLFFSGWKLRLGGPWLFANGHLVMNRAHVMTLMMGD